MKRKPFVCLLVFLFLSSLLFADEVIRYVDPDSAEGGDGTTWTLAYDSLQDWDTAEATDLQTAEDWHHVYCRSSSGTADTTNVLIGTDWNTGSDNYILIEAASTDRASASGWDTDKYRIIIAIDGEEALYVQALYAYVDGLQIESLGDGTPGECIYFSAASGEGRVSNCYLRNSGVGVYHSQSTGSFDLKVWNTIVDTMATDGIYHRTLTGSCYIYNCTVYGCTADGVQTGSADSMYVYNSAVFNNTNDFTGEIVTIDYCASVDNDGTNNVAESGGGASWTDDFEGAATGDFRLKSGSNLVGAGAVEPTGYLSVYDIEGTDRGVAWDVGAFEYVGGGGGSIVPIIVNEMRRRLWFVPMIWFVLSIWGYAVVRMINKL